MHSSVISNRCLCPYTSSKVVNSVLGGDFIKTAIGNADLRTVSLALTAVTAAGEAIQHLILTLRPRNVKLEGSSAHQ